MAAKLIYWAWIGSFPLTQLTRWALNLKGPDLGCDAHERTQGAIEALELLDKKKKAGEFDRDDPEQRAAMALIKLERNRLVEYLAPMILKAMVYDLNIAAGWLVVLAAVVFWVWL